MSVLLQDMTRCQVCCMSSITSVEQDHLRILMILLSALVTVLMEIACIVLNTWLSTSRVQLINVLSKIVLKHVFSRWSCQPIVH